MEKLAKLLGAIIVFEMVVLFSSLLTSSIKTGILSAPQGESKNAESIPVLMQS